MSEENQADGTPSASLTLCALWERKDKNGNMYLVGKLGDVQISIFKNGFKQKENHPDYFIKLQPRRTQQGSEPF